MDKRHPAKAKPHLFMVRFVYLTLMLLISSKNTWAHFPKDTTIVYLDEHLQLTSKRNSLFYGKTVSEGDRYLLIAYDVDSNLMYKAYYSDKRFRKNDGLATYYYATGLREMSGMYKAGVKTGAWVSWHDNGVPKDSGNYVNGMMEGLWTYWYPNGSLQAKVHMKIIEQVTVDETNKTQKHFISVLDSSYQSWHHNGYIDASGQYRLGNKVECWNYFHLNGKPSTKEWYTAAGKVDSMQCFDSAGNFQGNYCSLERPALLKHIGNFRNHLVNEFHVQPSGITQWPNGDITIKFTVTEDGKMKELKVISNKRVLAETVHKFMKQLPDWESAISHNRIVEWREEITLDFGFNKSQKLKHYQPEFEEFPHNAFEFSD